MGKSFVESNFNAIIISIGAGRIGNKFIRSGCKIDPIPEVDCFLVIGVGYGYRRIRIPE